MSAVLCPRAKGSRSFFLITTANSYSVMMKSIVFKTDKSSGEDLLDSGLVDRLKPIPILNIPLFLNDIFFS